MMVTTVIKPLPENPTTPTMSQSQSIGPDWLFSSAATKSCMFYKLMVASILQDKKLKIPEKFVKKYGEELSSFATVTVPNGRIWPVELQKIDDKIWFDNGWQEFVEFYSICVGYFLIFRYEGKSNFSIYIFDLKVSEIKYPFSTSRNLLETRHEYPAPFKKEVEDDEIKDIVCYGSPCLTSGPLKSKSFGERGSCNQIGALQSCGSRVTAFPDKFVPAFSSKEEKRTRRRRRRSETTSQKLERRSIRIESTCHTFTRRWRAVTVEEKRRTIHLADMFKPDNPFFKVVLRPSYVYRGFLLHVPSVFGRKYLNFTGLVTLQVSSERRWSVRCCYSGGHSKLIKGWTEFVWGNNLEEGDVCIFELTNLKDIVLTVTIFRVLEEAAPVNQALRIESGSS